MTVTIIHNPKCSKSRAVLALLKEHNLNPTIELYLEKSYSILQLQSLMKKLGLQSAREMMRTHEQLYNNLGLGKPNLTELELLQAICENPSLLERPIVINGDKAKIGRPPESILAIL